MKKIILIVAGALLCATAVTVIGQKKILSPKEERREVREKRRAERLAEFERSTDSLVLSRNFQFNPQTMQRQPAGPLRQLLNPNFTVSIWDGTADICLPYVKGYVPPYYTTILNYTVGNLQGYTTEQTHEGTATCSIREQSRSSISRRPARRPADKTKGNDPVRKRGDVSLFCVGAWLHR